MLVNLVKFQELSYIREIWDTDVDFALDQDAIDKYNASAVVLAWGLNKSNWLTNYSSSFLFEFDLRIIGSS